MPDRAGLLAFGRRVAHIIGAAVPTDAELTAFFEHLLSLEGRDSWACFAMGLVTDLEIRDLVVAHLETWFEHREGRRYMFVEQLDRADVLALEIALLGRPIASDRWPC